MVYKIDPREENEKLLYITYFNQGFKEMKLLDFANDS
jgi:hypothetical protein